MRKFVILMLSILIINISVPSIASAEEKDKGLDGVQVACIVGGSFVGAAMIGLVIAMIATDGKKISSNDPQNTILPGKTKIASIHSEEAGKAIKPKLNLTTNSKIADERNVKVLPDVFYNPQNKAVFLGATGVF